MHRRSEAQLGSLGWDDGKRYRSSKSALTNLWWSLVATKAERQSWIRWIWLVYSWCSTSVVRLGQIQPTANGTPRSSAVRCRNRGKNLVVIRNQQLWFPLQHLVAWTAEVVLDIQLLYSVWS